jgi:hypothetical protein
MNQQVNKNKNENNKNNSNNWSLADGGRQKQLSNTYLDWQPSRNIHLNLAFYTIKQHPML